MATALRYSAPCPDRAFGPGKRPFAKPALSSTRLLAQPVLSRIENSSVKSGLNCVRLFARLILTCLRFLAASTLSVRFFTSLRMTGSEGAQNNTR